MVGDAGLKLGSFVDRCGYLGAHGRVIASGPKGGR
jgi:hypothetical protein